MKLPKTCEKDCPLLLEGKCTAACRNHKDHVRKNKKPALLYIRDDGCLYVQMTADELTQIKEMIEFDESNESMFIRKKTHIIRGIILEILVRGVVLKEWSIKTIEDFHKGLFIHKDD